MNHVTALACKGFFNKYNQRNVLLNALHGE